MMGFSEVLHSITFVWLFSLSVGYYKQKEEIQRNNKKCHEHSTFDDVHKIDEPEVEDSEQFHDVDFLGQRSVSGMKDVEKQSKQRDIYRHSEKNQRKLQQLPTNHNNTEEEEEEYDTGDDTNVASNFSTFCMLLNEEEEIIDTEINNMNFTNATEFRLHLNMMTDDYPEETSWELLQHGNNEQPVIDSSFYNSTSELSNNTLHEFEYHCFVSGQDEEKEKEFCYDFDVKDSYGDGLCCEVGFGNFTLHLNDDSTPITSERYFYGKTLSTSFCVNKSGKLIKEKEKKHTKEYPSKECISDPCICDSNPALLLAEANDDTMHDIKVQVLTQIMSLSGYEDLSNVTSAQYKAACWLLNDDPYFIDHNNDLKNSTMMRKDTIEKSMIQRYILAVFYFSTKPQNWIDHYNFLTSQPECEWNDYSLIGGIICNDDDSIISIKLDQNNLDGSIANELYNLKSLEELSLHNNLLHGSIPSSLGRLSELRNIDLFKNFLDGEIPSELFHHSSNLLTFDVRDNLLTGTIPKSIGNVKRLSRLDLSVNNLSGSLPTQIYSLKKLINFSVHKNELSSTISSLIGNLSKVQKLYLDKNKFTGTIPSSIKYLSDLVDLTVNGNSLSGTIPDIFTSHQDLSFLAFHNNHLLTGTINDELCDNDLWGISADCRNDLFEPAVECSCCTFCTDRTPVNGGDCGDSSLSISFDHVKYGFGSFDQNSDKLQWSLTDESTDRVILEDGPYEGTLYGNDKSSYNACVTEVGCYSLNMIANPGRNTDYTVEWNNNLVFSDTFPGLDDDYDYGYGYGYDYNMTNVTKNYTMNFHYDGEGVTVGSAECSVVQFICDDEILSIEPNTAKRLMFDLAMGMSGAHKVKDPLSAQSQAICWIFTKEDFYESFRMDQSEKKILQGRFTQRYVLTLLHLVSANGLFGKDEYPPISHECEWNGVSCNDDGAFRIVTKIALSSEKNQIIGGELIQELGSLMYLEYLLLNKTELIGTIPNSFSNLYSLRELNLSKNRLTGSLQENFFDELSSLESLDLSNNHISGAIPSGLGISDISILRLNSNRFSGSLPLAGFRQFNLKILDVSENEFSGSISPSLLQHGSLEHLGLGSNFFVGSLEESIFDNLTKLKYFNVSKNELTGIIPSFHQKASDITHFDMHSNRFTGTLSTSLSQMLVVEHLNLQGNKLIGSIPVEINGLKNLRLLALSHNQLKGEIPINFKMLSNLDKLYLHSNELSGEAPNEEEVKMVDYITDCGYPSKALTPVDCSDCTICCNSEDQCQKKPRATSLNSSLIIVICSFCLLGLMVLIYSGKRKITNTKTLQNHFKNAAHWKASDLVGDKTVYHFLLTPNKVGWFIGLFCATAQLLTLFLFVRAGDLSNEDSDIKYTMLCSKNSLECEDKKNVSTYGYIILTWVLAAWLLRDIVGSMKLFMLAMYKQNIDFLVTSAIIFLVTFFSAWTSIYYNMAIGTKNTDIIVNAVILLFVNDLDEQLFSLAECCSASWVEEINQSLRRGSYHDRKKLMISRAIHKADKRIRSYASGSTFFSSSSRHGNNNIIDTERQQQQQQNDDEEDLKKVGSVGSNENKNGNDRRDLTTLSKDFVVGHGDSARRSEVKSGISFPEIMNDDFPIMEDEDEFSCESIIRDF